MRKMAESKDEKSKIKNPCFIPRDPYFSKSLKSS